MCINGNLNQATGEAKGTENREISGKGETWLTNTSLQKIHFHFKCLFSAVVFTSPSLRPHCHFRLRRVMHLVKQYAVWAQMPLYCTCIYEKNSEKSILFCKLLKQFSSIVDCIKASRMETESSVSRSWPVYVADDHVVTVILTTHKIPFLSY